MAVVVERYPHRTGEHCATTALRNILAFHGTELSEPMILGLAGGLGFYYLRSDAASPSRMFHGRTATLEIDFCDNAAIPFEERPEPDDAEAWKRVREQLDAGLPVLVSTDTFYLGYQGTSSHFPGHRCVVVGYDEAAESVLIADRKYDTYQRCSLDELRRSRNARDYPISCENRWGDFSGDVRPARPVDEAIVRALRRNADAMLRPPEGLPAGIPALRSLAADLPSWRDADDWSWAARFGYQVVIKRGAGGSFFRSLYADFLREASAWWPAIAESGLPDRMDEVAAGWRDLADVLKQQSERDECDPSLFEVAGRRAGQLADAEEAFFDEVLRVVAPDGG